MDSANRVKPVAGSCPCFLHIAPRSLSNAFFLPARLRARCGRAVGAGTYIDGSSKRSGLMRVSGVWGQDRREEAQRGRAAFKLPQLPPDKLLITAAARIR